MIRHETTKASSTLITVERFELRDDAEVIVDDGIHFRFIITGIIMDVRENLRVLDWEETPDDFLQQT